MDYKSFADRTKDKTFDELVHQGKRQAQRLMEDQGIAALALYISELMVKSLDAVRFEHLPQEAIRFGHLPQEEAVYAVSGNL